MRKHKSKKRHHYIPVFYLKGFTNENGCLYVYDKNDVGMFESSPESIAFEKHYFSFKTPKGEKDSETIENYIAEIEADSFKVINQILSKERLSEDERMTFACFVALMMVRVPNFRNNIQKSTAEMITHLNRFMASHKENFGHMVNRYEKDTGNQIGMPTEELRQWMLNTNNYTIDVNSQYAVGMALRQLGHFAKLFFNMHWTFLSATGDNKFITGDNPLSYIDPTHKQDSFYGVGLLNKNIEVTLPLSKDMCALGTWKLKDGHIKVNNQHVKNVNRTTVINSARFVFADYKSTSVDSFVKKYKGSHPIMEVG